MRWRPIPNQNEPSASLPVYVLEGFNDQLAIYRATEVPLINLPANTQADSTRQLAAFALAPQDGWLTAWPPRMGDSLLERPADFIKEDDAGVQSPRSF